MSSASEQRRWHAGGLWTAVQAASIAASGICVPNVFNGFLLPSEAQNSEDSGTSTSKLYKEGRTIEYLAFSNQIQVPNAQRDIAEEIKHHLAFFTAAVAKEHPHIDLRELSRTLQTLYSTPIDGSVSDIQSALGELAKASYCQPDWKLAAQVLLDETIHHLMSLTKRRSLEYKHKTLDALDSEAYRTAEALVLTIPSENTSDDDVYRFLNAICLANVCLRRRFPDQKSIKGVAVDREFRTIRSLLAKLLAKVTGQENEKQPVVWAENLQLRARNSKGAAYAMAMCGLWHITHQPAMTTHPDEANSESQAPQVRDEVDGASTFEPVPQSSVDRQIEQKEISPSCCERLAYLGRRLARSKAAQGAKNLVKKSCSAIKNAPGKLWNAVKLWNVQKRDKGKAKQAERKVSAPSGKQQQQRPSPAFLPPLPNGSSLGILPRSNERSAPVASLLDQTPAPREVPDTPRSMPSGPRPRSSLSLSTAKSSTCSVSSERDKRSLLNPLIPRKKVISPGDAEKLFDVTGGYSTRKESAGFANLFQIV